MQSFNARSINEIFSIIDKYDLPSLECLTEICEKFDISLDESKVLLDVYYARKIIDSTFFDAAESAVRIYEIGKTSNRNQVYPTTNEPSKMFQDSKYLLLDMFNSPVIVSVAASGDQIIYFLSFLAQAYQNPECIDVRTKDVILFDINPLTKYWCLAKLLCIKNGASYEKFMSIYSQTDFNFDFLDDDSLFPEVRYFWESLKELYFNDTANHIKRIFCNSHIEEMLISEDVYYALQEFLKEYDINIYFTEGDLKNYSDMQTDILNRYGIDISGCPCNFSNILGNFTPIETNEIIRQLSNMPYFMTSFYSNRDGSSNSRVEDPSNARTGEYGDVEGSFHF